MKRRRDEGAVLPLVLVLLVVGALIVLPLMSYAIAVMRSNTVLSERTKSIESGKGAVRVALSSPLDVFQNCDGGGDPIPVDPVINGVAVDLSCDEIQEVGPLLALGYDVPENAVAMQLGASVPAELSGTKSSSGPVPPYPTDGPGWWSDPAWTAREWALLRDGEIWLPDLPQFPATPRDADPFDMPPGFDCQVYFPGHYTEALNLSGNVYFTSGVYYFEEPVTVTSGADVVVGYGLADFGTDCADDIQVAANVIDPPATFDINGGGATWVFGENGRLAIDDATATAPIRVRFNQRYAAEDRGGRISIMSVNGDDVSAADHFVTDVNEVPRSFVRVGESAGALGGSGYTPSSSLLTDKARPPAEVPALSAADRKDPSASSQGVILFTWDEVAGQAAGGAWLGVQDPGGDWTTPPYHVQIRKNDPGEGWIDVCPPEELVLTPKPDPAEGNEVACLISGLDLDQEYRVRVRAQSEAGAGPWSERNATPVTGSPDVTVPAAPAGVVAVAGADDDTAVVTWDVPDNGGTPITGYDVTATRVYVEPQPNVAPVVIGSAAVVVERGSPVVISPPVFDPNAEPLTVTVDDSALVAAGGAPTIVTGTDVTIDAGTAADGTYVLPYTATDTAGPPVPGTIEVTVVGAAGANQAPVTPVFQVAANVGTPMDVHVPAFDPDGDPLTLDVDDAALDPSDWTFVVDPAGLVATITTTAADGTYSIPYTVTDDQGAPSSGTIDVVVVRGYEAAGGCTVAAGPLLPVAASCEIGALPDLAPGDAASGNVGYRFDVIARNAVGSSHVGSSAEPYPLAFDGGGESLPPTPLRVLTPWVPEPIVEIDASNAGVAVDVAIAGYVSVPMGRLAVANPEGDSISINGGVAVGTFDVTDGRAIPAESDSVPIGFKNDIVLQRTVRITARARNIVATAVVQINEDGGGYAINSWTVE